MLQCQKMAERKVFTDPVTANGNSQALRQVTCGWIITVGCPGVSLSFVVEDTEQRISWGALDYCCQQEGKGLNPGTVADTSSCHPGVGVHRCSS